MNKTEKSILRTILQMSYPLQIKNSKVALDDTLKNRAFVQKLFYWINTDDIDSFICEDKIYVRIKEIIMYFLDIVKREAKMNKTERSILHCVLLLARDFFHGCDDFELDNTPENYEFAKKCNEYTGDGDPYIHKGKICMVDYLLIEYFAEVFDDKT